MYPILFRSEAPERNYSTKKTSPRSTDGAIKDCSDDDDAGHLMKMKVKEEHKGVARKKRSRFACLPCRQRKVRCEGGQPCALCLKQERQCVYPFKARMAMAQQQQSQAGAASAYSPQRSIESRHSFQAVADFESSPEVGDAEPIPMSIASVGDRFGTKEFSYLNAYFKVCYHYLPLVSQTQVKCSLSYDLNSRTSMAQVERASMNASLASTWAVAAIGGCFIDSGSATRCLYTALEYLRDCFDVPFSGSVNAYLAVCEACYRLGWEDTSSWMKYVGFAEILEREVAPGELPPATRAVLSFYHKMLVTTPNDQQPSPASCEVPFVLNRSFVDPVVQSIEVMAAGYELIGLLVHHKLDGTASKHLQKQIDGTVMHLTAMAIDLAADSTTVDSKNSVNYFMVNVFLSYFHVMAGRLREASFCLGEMVAAQEVCPFTLQCPRTVRCPFLMLQVMEKLQLWEVRDKHMRLIQQLGLVYDGKADHSRLEEVMIVDMIRSLDAQLQTQTTTSAQFHERQSPQADLTVPAHRAQPVELHSSLGRSSTFSSPSQSRIPSFSPRQFNLQPASHPPAQQDRRHKKRPLPQESRSSSEECDKLARTFYMQPQHPQSQFPPHLSEQLMVSPTIISDDDTFPILEESQLLHVSAAVFEYFDNATDVDFDSLFTFLS